MLVSIRLYVLQNLFERYRQEMKYSISLRKLLEEIYYRERRQILREKVHEIIDDENFNSA